MAAAEKQPTDAAIIKGFDKFEQGFNVYIQWFRNHPDDDIALHMHYEIDSMWAAHKAYRELAVAAHARKDAANHARKGH